MKIVYSITEYWLDKETGKTKKVKFKFKEFYKVMEELKYTQPFLDGKPYIDSDGKIIEYSGILTKIEIKNIYWGLLACRK